MKLTAVLLLLATASIHADQLKILIGTNTGGSGKSEGIYASTFDTGSGEFTEVQLWAKYTNPNFLAVNADKRLIYAVGNSKAEPRGAVAAFSLDGGGDRLKAEAPSGGNGPCHLALSADGNTLGIANYSSGTTASIHINADGLFNGVASTLATGGHGPRADRQEGPHTHGIYFAGNHMLVPDLGTDKVLAFDVDPATSFLTTAKPAGWNAKPGSGPRHLAFSPDNKNVYVVNELENTVTACTFNAAAGTMETLQESLPTLPPDWKGKNTTAEIAVHPNGRYVYVSNRGHDSIAVFQRDLESGKLSPLQIAPCGGAVPRFFCIAPGGRWIVCANQDSNTLTSLPIDATTGLLGDPKGSVIAPNPVCVVFLP